MTGLAPKSTFITPDPWMMLEAVDQAVVATDMAGHILYFNGVAEKLFGWPAAEALGRNVVDIFPAPDTEEQTLAIMAQLRQGHRWSGEFRLRRRDGTIFVAEVTNSPMVDANGQVVGIVGLSRELPGRHQLDLALSRALHDLHESEIRYRTIGEAIDYGVWICDADGHNTYASQSLLDLLGYTFEEIQGLGWARFLHPDDAEDTAKAWLDCVKTGEDWTREHRYLGKDGCYHPVLARGKPLRDETGVITAWVGINLDIADLKQVHANLQNTIQEKERLLRQNELLIREVNHRIKNGLTLVTSFLTLQAKLSGSTQVKQELHEAVARVGTVARVHERLYQGDAVDTLDLGDFVRELCRDMASDRLSCDVSCDPGGALLLEPDRAIPLALILNEWVTNAHKYAYSAGQNGAIEVTLRREAGTISMQVRDYGIGLPESFDFRSRTGLGMQVVSALTRQLNADVTFERLSPGTRFSISLAG